MALDLLQLVIKKKKTLLIFIGTARNARMLKTIIVEHIIKIMIHKLRELLLPPHERRPRQLIKMRGRMIDCDD